MQLSTGFEQSPQAALQSLKVASKLSASLRGVFILTWASGSLTLPSVSSEDEERVLPD